MTHLDLFSGIGGFAYAADQVFGGVEHIFCDNDPFCRKVVAKHWPESEIYDDIRTITTPLKANLVTGGFPCQPFSHAGQRRGTDDNRYLWPEMLRVIELTHPEWVIAENVRGLLTWNGGMVFEQVCSDLEAAGYAVQAFVIPAVAVNAPHRRDRVWFVGKSINASSDGLEGFNHPSQAAQGRWPKAEPEPANTRDWREVAAELCRVDDGLPAKLDGLELIPKHHRRERLKSLGNAIVPQVAMEIMAAMR